MAGVGRKTGKKSPKASPGGSSAGAGGDPGTVVFDAMRVLRKIRVPVQDLSALEARYPPALPRGYRDRLGDRVMPIRSASGNKQDLLDRWLASAATAMAISDAVGT